MSSLKITGMILISSLCLQLISPLRISGSEVEVEVEEADEEGEGREFSALTGCVGDVLVMVEDEKREKLNNDGEEDREELKRLRSCSASAKPAFPNANDNELGGL